MRFRAAGGYPGGRPPKKGFKAPPQAGSLRQHLERQQHGPPFPNFLLSRRQRHFRAEDKRTQSQVKLLIQLRNGLLSNSRPNRELKKNFKRGLAPLVTTMLPFAAHHILIKSKTVSTGWLSFKRSQACLTMKRKRALLQLERKEPIKRFPVRSGDSPPHLMVFLTKYFLLPARLKYRGRFGVG